MGLNSTLFIILFNFKNQPIQLNMEQQPPQPPLGQQPFGQEPLGQPLKLPRATSALVLSILSIVLCCTGIGGLVLGGVALMQTSKDKKLYQESPGSYDNYGQVQAAKVIAIIGIIISAYIIYSLVSAYIQFGGWEGFMEEIERAMEEAGVQMD